MQNVTGRLRNLKQRFCKMCIRDRDVGFQRQPGCWLRSSHTFKECVIAVSYTHLMKFKFRVSCIIENNGRFLLHKRKADSFWNFLGGRVKLGELCEDAIKREIREEIGCKCKIDQLVKVCENFYKFKDTTFHEILVIFKVTLLDELKEECVENKLVIGWLSLIHI